MARGPPLQERRDLMVGACDGLVGLGSELWRAGSGDLEEIRAEADRMVAAWEAARAEVLAEAMSRGEAGSGGPRPLTPVQWVRRRARSTRAGGAAQVVGVAQSFAVNAQGHEGRHQGVSHDLLHVWEPSGRAPRPAA